MDRVQNAAEIDVHHVVCLAECFAGTVSPQPALNSGIGDHQLERRGAVGAVNPSGDSRGLGYIEASLDHPGATLAA